MPVETRAIEYDAALPQWTKIDDCIAGEAAVKGKKTEYLPDPYPEDTSPEARKRYANYLARACFIAYTATTLGNLVGQLFAKEPVLEGWPDSLKFVVQNADGAGSTLDQIAKCAANQLVPKSRAGLFVDYPQVAGTPSLQEKTENGLRARIAVYAPQDITNWLVEVRGGELVIKMVTLKETRSVPVEGDPFAFNRETQYRVLWLRDGVYSWEVHRQSGSGALWTKVEEGTPQDGAGNPFKEIPFQFIGAETNTANVQKPLLGSLADLNIAHFHNSADREDNVFRSGQATPVFSGLTQDWVDDVLKGSVRMGAAGGVLLPVGASGSFMQAEAADGITSAMEHKEKQMLAIGARLVAPSETAKTATEDDNDNAAETSALATLALNLDAGIKRALLWVAQFENVPVDGEKLFYKLNKDYARPRMSGDEVDKTVSAWERKAITFSEMRDTLKRGGVASLTDEEARAELDEAADEETTRLLSETKATLQLEKQLAVKQPPAAQPPAA